MDELIARLEAAADCMVSWLPAAVETGAAEEWRTRGKLDGIRLALSYARETR